MNVVWRREVWVLVTTFELRGTERALLGQSIPYPKIPYIIHGTRLYLEEDINTKMIWREQHIHLSTLSTAELGKPVQITQPPSVIL